ncbi:hypothetical protein Poly41_50520 [Novipirellula artificiosorum]|uniref:Uncharacterized protein n=1 Tax=Novipirellula artificiosorum TaxID=2528016 RepID=A0A5C6D8X5_9BACT|nr:hypothetical protein Poly41_50520 [Novipirellula artificiosorum]
MWTLPASYKDLRLRCKVADNRKKGGEGKNR